MAPPPWSPETEALLRIAFIITRADAVGGASIHVRDLAAHLARSGHHVMVFLGGVGAVTDALTVAGVPFKVVPHMIRNVSPKKDLLAFARLRRELREFKPDLVSCHTSKAGVLGRLAAWSLGCPAVYTPHCWSFVDGFPGAKTYLWAERLARPFGKKIIMVSEAERQDGLRHRVASPRHLVTVHNGMPDVPAAMRATPEGCPPRIVMVGRFEEQKDHQTLLRALARLKELPWVLDLVGDGPLRPSQVDLAHSLGIAERVNFLCYRNDVAHILKDAQIFALVTNWEGFPRSIIEAMRAGLPVIATDVGGNRESVTHGKTGFLVHRGDVDELEQRLRSLILDESLRRDLGANGRRAYEADFTLGKLVANTLAVWAGVLGMPVNSIRTLALPATHTDSRAEKVGA